MLTFTEYLKDIHANGYTGTDDDMPDAFEKWISGLQVNDFIEYADMYAEHHTLCYKIRLTLSPKLGLNQ